MAIKDAIDGPALVHVGERKSGDGSGFATDEYLLAPPGTIVAPRRKGEKPTPDNAARAILRQGKKMGMLPKETTMANLPAYAAFQKAQSMAGAAQPTTPSRPRSEAVGRVSGPPAYQRLKGAQTGTGVSSGATTAAPAASTAVNPVADALKAIQSVGAARGLDPAGAASLLNTGGVPATQGPQNNMAQAEGTNAMGNFLQQLLMGGQLTGPDLMLAQVALMSSLGMIDPRAIGITDPAVFRTLLAEGQGMPTLEAQKQRFNESLFGFSASAPSRGNVPTVASS